MIRTIYPSLSLILISLLQQMQGFTNDVFIPNAYSVKGNYYILWVYWIAMYLISKFTPINTMDYKDIPKGYIVRGNY